MKYRILFAEDEKILGTLVKESLEKHDYDVMHITAGSDVLQAYRDFAPHLCLLDIMMPGKDGYQVAAQIRNIDKYIPIIFLTAKIQTQDLVKGFSAGCNDYIRKPFSIDEVLIRINSWIKEKHGNQQEDTTDEIMIGAFLFLADKLELHTPEGETLKLTYKDSAILKLLYQHRNAVVTREDILNKVWGSHTMYNSRTLDVYINRLRKYFQNTPNKIITLKGVGYRFICE